MRSCNTEYLLHSCDRFIVTGLWINRLQIIILTTNTLLQVWLVFLWFLVTCLFYQKLHEFNSIRYVAVTQNINTVLYNCDRFHCQIYRQIC